MPPGPATLRMTILIRESDLFQQKPLHHEILVRARRAGLAGASVMRCLDGYGTPGQRRSRRSRLRNRPVAVTIVDAESRIREFLSELDGMIEEGMVILDRVTLM
jgi:uncharacterized protein